MLLCFYKKVYIGTWSNQEPYGRCEMSVMIISSLAAASVVVGGVAYKMLTNYKEENKEYYIKDSPEGKKAYKESKKQNSGPEMSSEEKLDLSWQFLYDITNKIMSSFSQEDQSRVLELGRVLLSFGGTYHHVIDYGIRQNYGLRKKDDAAGGISKGS